MSDVDPWIQAVIAILTSGSMAALVQVARELYKHRASKKYDSGYSHIREIYELIQQLLSDSKANRVLVLLSENGGGIPSPGTQVKTSVYHEVCDSPAKPISEFWQLVPIDQDYASVLADINTKGHATLEVSELHETALRDLLVVGEASRVYMFRICATPHALLYLSIQYHGDEVMSEHDRVETRGIVTQLCGIFNKHHYLVKKEK